MSMARDNENTLEQSRNDKIKALGFLCYNLYVDKVMNFPEMNGIVNDIKETLSYLLVLRQNNTDDSFILIQESKLDEKLTELGCICYNLYVDSKLFNNQLLSLCDSISSISHEISNGLTTPSPQEEIEKQTGLKNSCPYGMEPIPANPRKCVCGYRNKAVAKFCGKCGAKLS